MLSRSGTAGPQVGAMAGTVGVVSVLNRDVGCLDDAS
jgi:hypothetical protein